MLKNYAKGFCKLMVIGMLFLSISACANTTTNPAAQTEPVTTENTENTSEPTGEPNSSEQSTTSDRIQFTDLAGREIVLDGPAERIFLGFYGESFLAINGGLDNVVSLSKGEWADFFNGQYLAYEKNLPEIQDIVDTGSIYQGSFGMETMLNTNPDVAIVAPFQYETLGENVSKLERAGITVVVVDFNSQTVEKHVQSTIIIGMITGNEERAQKLADDYVAAIEDVAARIESLTEDEKIRVYVELGNLGSSEYGNSYGEYLWGSLVMMAGGNNIAYGKVDSYGALSPEYILTSNPEVIVFAGSNWINDTGNRVKIGLGIDPQTTNDRITPYLQRPGWNKLTAINNGEIYAVDHAGLRSIYDYVYVQYFAKSFYPDLFSDIDPEQNLLDFYEQYLPIEPDGTFMLKYNQS